MLGLNKKDCIVRIGDSQFPASGASGGSTTVGGVSSSVRRGALLALEELFKRVAPELGVEPESLEAVAGRIQFKKHPHIYMT